MSAKLCNLESETESEKSYDSDETYHSESEFSEIEQKPNLEGPS
jgi:hypothetical protein